MLRIVRGLSATLSHTFYVDGVATDPSPDTATVTITRDDGTAVVTGAAATNAGTGVVTYTLTPAQTATLDILTVAWTATFGGQAQTFTDVVEVAGGVLFTVAQALATDGLSAKTAAQITEKRTLVEELLENACGVAFVPRYGKTTISGNGRSTIMLPPRTTAIRSVTLDGVSIGATALATIKVLASGEVYYPSWWTAGYANYEIAYEHGYSDGPERMAAGDAALTWAKMLLLSGPIDDRATGTATEFGNITLATPGMRGSVSGIPSVDQFIQSYNLSVCVA
jgi:hypothetical protein